MLLLQLLYITIITTIIIDISGFITTVKNTLSSFLHTSGSRIHLKPLDCSFCTNFWLSLAYLIYTGKLSLALIAYILLLSTLTPFISSIIILLRELLINISNKLYDVIK